MNKRSSASARIIAATTLVAAFVLILIVIGGALGGDSEDSSGRNGGKTAHRKAASRPKHVPETYEVKSGDTLISIAHETGVPVVRIQELNPEVDPQILIAGEQLKLR